MNAYNMDRGYSIHRYEDVLDALMYLSRRIWETDDDIYANAVAQKAIVEIVALRSIIKHKCDKAVIDAHISAGNLTSPDLFREEK